MSDLAAFLLARIAEDEEVARAATPGPWGFRESDNVVDPVDDDEKQGWYVTVREPDGFGHDTVVVRKLVRDDDAKYIARWNPARVLAECAAKRTVVEIHKPVSAREMGGQSDTLLTCGMCGPDEDVDFRIQWREMHYPCPTIRALAQVYADHPDFAEEWRDERS